MLRNFRAVIVGAPGSGKGTISSRIVRKFDVKHVSSGDVIRRHLMKGTPLGLATKKYVESGRLVPDDMMVEMIVQELKGTPEGWLLDGFPRTAPQAKVLESEIGPVDAAINLVVPLEVIERRIAGRWIHPASGRVYNTSYNPPRLPGRDDVTGEPLVQREDDIPEAVRHRLIVYSKTVGPVLDFFKERGLLEEFAGETSDEIWPQVYRYLMLKVSPVTQDVRL
ncbi:hypothetical protein AAG570_003522 [Ranatra chinensis]|uniref:GTP:AMP phosphotransferase, mitochondrial n=1 Tax=Ranatra chinensis TaxID=642074 RepID=A0ABD0Y3W3_9HEMI